MRYEKKKENKHNSCLFVLKQTQIFDWAVINGQLDSMKLILEIALPRMIEQTLMNDEWDIEMEDFAWQREEKFDVCFALAAAIHYDRFEIFHELLKFRDGVRLIPIFHEKTPFLPKFYEKGENGLKYYESFLNSPIVQFNPNDNFIDMIIQHGGQYFKTAIKTFLARGSEKNFQFENEDGYVSQERVKKTLDYLVNQFNNDKDAQKLAARFALLTNSQSILLEILEREKFTDCDLLDLLRLGDEHHAPKVNFQAVRLIWNSISPTAKVQPQHIENLLWSFFDAIPMFLVFWNDQRFEPTPELIRKLILRAISVDLKSPILPTMLPLVSLSDLAEYNLGRGFYWPEEIVKTTFHNCVFLAACKNIANGHTELKGFLARLKLEMTEDLFCMGLRVFLKRASILSDKGFERLNISHVKPEWWNSHRLHAILLKICKFSAQSFPQFLEKFPSVDLSRNNNEALRVLLEHQHLQGREETNAKIICSALAKQIQFLDKYQRQEFLDLIKLKREILDIHERPYLFEIVERIPVKC